MDSRPIWAFPGWARDRMADAVPEGWSVAVLDAPASGAGDGVHRAPPELLDAAHGARAYVGYGIPPEFLDAAPELGWAHSGAAGVTSSLTPEMLSRPICFTNSAGIHGPPVAETALAAMLYFARGLDVALRAQRDGRWGAEDFWSADSPVTEFGAAVTGVIGFGGIGREVARRALAMGSRVLALRRVGGRPEANARPDDPAKDGLFDGLELSAGEEALDRIVALADYLVLAVPETPRTRGMIDRRRLFSMKPGSVLVNVARGSLVDEAALLDALDAGPVRGAALDVFRQEPLPSGHPFFVHPRVLVTPHVSATTRLYWERQTELVVDNIGRFARGEPLRNVVDKQAGY